MNNDLIWFKKLLIKKQKKIKNHGGEENRVCIYRLTKKKKKKRCKKKNKNKIKYYDTTLWVSLHNAQQKNCGGGGGGGCGCAFPF